MHSEQKSSEVLSIVMREQRLALSEREWKHRLCGYGYGIRDTDEGRVVTSLISNAALCQMPGGVAL